MRKRRTTHRSLVKLFLIGAALPCAALADVTVEQSTAFDFGSVVRMHGMTTDSVTADKKRSDTETHCEGVMSLVCGNAHSGDIIRLDRSLTWHLEPDKKRYREDVFATPEQMQLMRARMQANLEKMRSCPVQQQQQGPAPPDKSKCQMSEPKIAVRKTGDTRSIAGHTAARTAATLTESCTDKDTGSVCDTVVAFDVWLTQDTLPGGDDQRAFAHSYAQKLGIDDSAAMMRGAAAKYLAAYQQQIKQLTDKSSDFKGLPLRTTVRVLVGGEHCPDATKNKTDDASSGGTGPAAGGGGPGGFGLGGAIMGKLAGGLFNKKPVDSAAAAPDASLDPYPAYVQVLQYTSETTAIKTDGIPADRFEVPADWKKEIPKPVKDDTEFTCPKTGG